MLVPIIEENKFDGHVLSQNLVTLPSAPCIQNIALPTRGKPTLTLGTLVSLLGF